jgi:ferrous iron transport protein A
MSNTTNRLSDLKPREKGVIRRINSAGGTRRRMLDMGLTAGTEVTVVRVAPLGDPIEFDVRGYHLSLRKSEALEIEIGEIEPAPADPQGVRR